MAQMLDDATKTADRNQELYLRQLAAAPAANLQQKLAEWLYRALAPAIDIPARPPNRSRPTVPKYAIQKRQFHGRQSKTLTVPYQLSQPGTPGRMKVARSRSK
jgi:hypothetical protein